MDEAAAATLKMASERRNLVWSNQHAVAALVIVHVLLLTPQYSSLVHPCMPAPCPCFCGVVNVCVRVGGCWVKTDNGHAESFFFLGQNEAKKSRHCYQRACDGGINGGFFFGPAW
jgi:hypothetical protein